MLHIFEKLVERWIVQFVNGISIKSSPGRTDSCLIDVTLKPIFSKPTVDRAFDPKIIRDINLGNQAFQPMTLDWHCIWFEEEKILISRSHLFVGKHSKEHRIGAREVKI